MHLLSKQFEQVAEKQLHRYTFEIRDVKSISLNQSTYSNYIAMHGSAKATHLLGFKHYSLLNPKKQTEKCKTSQHPASSHYTPSHTAMWFGLLVVWHPTEDLEFPLPADKHLRRGDGEWVRERERGTTCVPSTRAQHSLAGWRNPMLTDQVSLVITDPLAAGLDSLAPSHHYKISSLAKPPQSSVWLYEHKHPANQRGPWLLSAVLCCSGY